MRKLQKEETKEKMSRNKIEENQNQQTNHPVQLLQGTFDANARGFGFVTVEGMEEDLFVPPDKKGGAFFGDTVEVRLLPSFGGRDGKRREAEVVRIVSRGFDHLVGTFERQNHQCFVTPDNRKIASDIRVAQEDSMNAVNGHKVVVKITDYGDGKGNAQHQLKGKVTEILGHMDDPGVDILSIIRAYDLPGEFPEEVMKEVRRIPQTIGPALQEFPEPKEPVGADLETPAGAGHETEEYVREDWRDITTVTIDGPDTKDIDDAISVEKVGDHWILGVHIADVAGYVKEGSALDKEALQRATSNYLVDRVIPMLPHELSTGICSLNPGEDRFALSCIMTLDRKGTVTDSRVAETVIRSDAKLSYPGVMSLFNEKDETEILQQLQLQGVRRGIKGKSHKIAAMLRRARRLARILARARIARGSLEFESSECDIILNEAGIPVQIVPHKRNEATDMIEDFMLMANATVAQTFCRLQLPFVYRTHGQPSEDKIAQLSRFISNYGYHLPGHDVHPKEIQKLLEELKGTPEESMISMMTLRSMQRAEYTTSCDGHFGLALKYYCHFTSPIRRYPDLQIHRIIKEYLHGKLTGKRTEHYQSILPAVCSQSSSMERRADEAERETDKQKKTEWMHGHLGETFGGVIDGVTGWGFYVQLPNTVEGMVPVASLTDDYYNYDEASNSLVGERTGRTFRLGQKVKVIAAAADVQARQIDFTLSDMPESPAGKRQARHENRQGADPGRPKRVRKDGSAFRPDHGRHRHHHHR